MRGLAQVDLLQFDGEQRRIEKAFCRLRQPRRIGDHAVANAEGALGHFDETVGEFEGLGRFDAKLLVESEDDERGEALGRRRRVVGGADIELDRQRVGQHRAVAQHVVARHRAADLFEVGRKLASHVAAVEIAEAGMGELIERRRERSLLQRRAGLRRLAVRQECRGKARHLLQFGELFRCEPRLAVRHDVAFARLVDRGPSNTLSGSFPPKNLAASSASIQPPTAPGTVSAASGPRAGIVSRSL